VEKKASDLFLTCFAPVKIKIDGKIIPVNKLELTPQMVRQAAMELMTQEQLEEFNRELEIDFAISKAGLGRFRVNIFHQRGNVALVMRYITGDMPDLDDIGMPPIIKDLVMFRRGLLLMVGATGSGKSTTLAGMINYRNEKTASHILTIEDPIEFVHQRRKCLISQREIGVHSPSFAAALHSALREDPDVILVGEMRDLETVSIAVTAAEMGILVMGTLHTNGAAQTVDRIVNAFPTDKQSHVRTMLSTSLRGVISQQLVPRKGEPGLVAALEIMVNTPAVSNLIRQGKLDQLETAMQGGGRTGMRTMDSALKELLDQGRITGRSAYESALEKRKFEDVKDLVN
jgi:pilus retraction protein PilT